MSGQRLLFAICLCVWPLGAEAAQLTGTVKSQHGQSISRVQITLQEVEGARSTYSAESAANGRFEFRDVPPGVYRLQAVKERWLAVEQLVTLKEQSVFEAPQDVALAMELTPLFVILNRVQMASVLYVLGFSLLVLVFNYYLVPDPSRGVAIVGWCGVGLTVLVSFAKHGWLEFLGIAVAGCGAAWWIQSHGSRVAARRLRQEREERSTEQAVAEQRQLELESLVGQQGVAVCDLKSCGTIRVNGKDLPARASRGFVGTDSVVVVIRMEGVTAVVDRVTAT